MLLLPDPLGTTASALSPSFHDFPPMPSGRGIPVGGRYEITTRGALRAYPRPAVGGIAGVRARPEKNRAPGPGGRGDAWCCSSREQPASFRFLPFFP